MNVARFMDLSCCWVIDKECLLTQCKSKVNPSDGSVREFFVLILRDGEHSFATKGLNGGY